MKIISKVYIFFILVSRTGLCTCSFAQEKAQSPDPFIQSLMQLNHHLQWRIFKKPKPQDYQAAGEDDLKELQGLSYLQGYNAPPPFKNVILYNKNKTFPGYNLFLSANEPAATLMDMNGAVIHCWIFPCSSLPVEKQYCTDYWVRARLFNNGDLLALIPYVGLLKVDKQSHLLWFTRLLGHHDFDLDSNGNIYTLTVKSSRLKDNTSIVVNSVTILSPNGRMIKEISLYDLLRKYPDPAYIHKIDELAHVTSFYSHRGWKIHPNIAGDVFHANSIQVLDGQWSAQVPAFRKGNLLISIRQLGLIIAVNPEKEKIEWLRDSLFWDIGQHFAKLLGNGNILLFDNRFRLHPKLSRIVELDPVKNKMVWAYANQNIHFYTPIVGECYRLPNGNTLITDSTNGHSFEVTPAKEIVWEYYSPYRSGKNQSLIAMIYQMQRIPMDAVRGWIKN